MDIVPAALSDEELLSELSRRAASERESTAALIALLAEMDARRLHLAQGCSSLFRYCTERLHLSEDAAYHRIEAARAVRRFPVILESLACGDLSLTTVAMLGRHLTTDNHESLLEEARGRSKREVEVIVRRIAPLPDVRSSIRRVIGMAAAPVVAAEKVVGPTVVLFEASPTTAAPESAILPVTCVQPDSGALSLATAPAPASASIPLLAPLAASPRRAEVRALSPVTYSLRVTLSADAHGKLRRAQDLLRHQIPNGDSALIVERALTLLVEHLERAKFSKLTEHRRKKERAAAKRKGHRRETESTESATRKERTPKMKLTTPTTPKEDAPQTAPAESGMRKDDRCSHSGRGGRGKRRSRRIPAPVRREVWGRDQGRCAFVGTAGRCTETGKLEFHHVVPFADGGEATAANLELRCRSHNLHESDRWDRVASPWMEPHDGATSDRGSPARPGPS